MIGASEETEQLAAAALAGDEEALGSLLSVYQQAAYGVAYRLLGSQPDAADAVQEAFLLALRALRSADARPRDAHAFKSWFLRIVTNAALQRLRRRPRLSPVSVDDMVEQLPDIGEEQPAEEVERREVRGDVLRALLALPDSQRAALTLREFEELSYDEIAEALGTSRMSVQMLLFRARRNFRSAYEGLAGQDHLIGCAELAPILSALLDHELEGKAWLNVSLHLAHCAHCRNELAELRKSRRLVARMPLIPLPADWSWPGSPGQEVAVQSAAIAQAAPPLGTAVPTIAQAAPAIAQGMAQLGLLTRAAAALTAVGIGVGVATSPSWGGHAPSDGEGPAAAAIVQAAVREDRDLTVAANEGADAAALDAQVAIAIDGIGFAREAPVSSEGDARQTPESHARTTAASDAGGSVDEASAVPRPAGGSPPAGSGAVSTAGPTADGNAADASQAGSAPSGAAAPVQTAFDTAGTVAELSAQVSVQPAPLADAVVLPVADALTAVPTVVPAIPPAIAAVPTVVEQAVAPIPTIVEQAVAPVPTAVAEAAAVVPTTVAQAAAVVPTVVAAPAQAVGAAHTTVPTVIGGGATAPTPRPTATRVPVIAPPVQAPGIPPAVPTAPLLQRTVPMPGAVPTLPIRP